MLTEFVVSRFTFDGFLNVCRTCLTIQRETTRRQNYREVAPPPEREKVKANLPSAEGDIYVIQGKFGGPIKIGFSFSFRHSRITAYETHTPFPVRLIAIAQGTRVFENFLHTTFIVHRHYKEWFRPAPEIWEYLKQDNRFTIKSEMAFNLNIVFDLEGAALIDKP